MSNEERIRKLFDATPEQLTAIDAALAGKVYTQDRPTTMRLIRIGEAAKVTGLSRCTLWRAIREGCLRTVEIRRGSHRIPEAELISFTNGRAV